MGILIGLLLPFGQKAPTKELRSKESKYSYINPLLECENASFEDFDNTYDLQNILQKRIDVGFDKGEITSAAVYYQDLNNGPWFGINENKKFSPASLIKVPLMIALFKQTESQPDLLQSKVTINSNINYDNQNFIPKKHLIGGGSYEIQQLIEQMIIYSDNNAFDALLNKADQNILARVYNDLGINIDKLNSETPNGNILSVKEYAGFFKILFNASYLSNDSSETALSILSQSNYTDGLVAGTPDGTKVAHKFGERYYTFSGSQQLHDCGIVYHPKRPYLLCVMTEGKTFENLSKTIQDISWIVYDENNQE